MRRENNGNKKIFKKSEKDKELENHPALRYMSKEDLKYLIEKTNKY